MRINVKRRKHYALNKWYIVIILIIVLFLISTSYSLWSSQLYIEGNVSGEYEPPLLPVDVEMVNNNDYIDLIFGDDNGWNIIGSIYVFEGDSFDSNTNTLTTTIDKQRDSIIVNPDIDFDITFTIQNNTDSMFTNGNIQLVEYNDPGNITNGNNINCSIGSSTISSGGSTEINLSGIFKGQGDVNNTHFDFQITYDIDGVTHYFYYNIVVQ